MEEKKFAARKWFIRSLIALALIAAGIYLAPKVVYYLAHEHTDDAYADGTIVPVSAEIKGKVVKVFIDDNQRVAAGQPLLEIDREDYTTMIKEKTEALAEAMAGERRIASLIEAKTNELAQARADLAAAQTLEKLGEREKKRYETLLAKKLISQSQYDHIESQWMVEKARADAAAAAVARVEAERVSLKVQVEAQQSKINQATASLDLANLQLKRTTVKAPVAGRIAKKNVDAGKYVQPGQSLCAVVAADNIWITANFKETQLKKMRKGQPVEIRVDAYPGIVFNGHVDSFQPGTGAVFSLLPPENATGNFVKVVQRVSVKIVLDSPPDSAHPLWPGLSVIPYVDVSAG